MNSLIIPVYKNEGSLPDLFQALHSLQSQMQAALEVVFVVDGSPDRCAEIIRNHLPTFSFPAQLVLLSRNFGSFAAIRAGLTQAKGQNFAVMAADLQEPPELILDFYKSLENGECDIVLGTRRSRQDPWLSKLFSSIFWGVYRKVVQADVPRNGVDIFGCNRIFRDSLISLRESNSSLIGLIFWLGYRRKFVEYDRLTRQHGKSAWTFRKKLKYFYDNFFSFSDLPIRLLIWVGGMGIGFSVLLSIIVIMNKIFGLITVPGYTATVLLILFFAGINSLGLGIIGSYVYRAFENTKGRPEYAILQSLTNAKD